MNGRVRLSDMRVGERATVTALATGGGMRRRLMDIGLLQDAAVECVGKSPAGDPAAYLIAGAVIAIRREDGKNIFVHPQGAR